MNFEHDYIEFDNGEVKLIRCVSCGKTLAERQAVPTVVRTDPPQEKWVEKLVRSKDMRQVRIVISDGSFIEPFVCSGCEKKIDVNIEADPTMAENLRSQLERAAVEEAKHKHRSAAEIASIRKRHKFEVLKSIPSEGPDDSRKKALLIAMRHEERRKKHADGRPGGK